MTIYRAESAQLSVSKVSLVTQLQASHSQTLELHHTCLLAKNGA